MNQNETDWAKVRAAADADAPIAFDPETDPYNPNDAAATRAYWQAAKITAPSVVLLSQKGAAPGVDHVR